MRDGDDQSLKWRQALERASAKNRAHDEIDALSALERLEPREARWPHRLGDAYRRIGKTKDAEEAYVRACDLLAREGHLPRAVALAKLIVSLNPARADMLERIDQDAARDLRARALPRESPPLRPTQNQFGPAPVAIPPAPTPVASPEVLPPGVYPLHESGARPDPHGHHAEPAPTPTPLRVPTPAHAPTPTPARRFVPTPPVRPHHAGGAAQGHPPILPPAPELSAPDAGTSARSPSLLSQAQPLAPALDREQDEVRFLDAADENAIELDVSDIQAISLPPAEGVVSDPPPESPKAALVAQLSASRLFAEVSQAVLGALLRASERVELAAGADLFAKRAPADSLFVIVEGIAWVALPWLEHGGVELSEGQIVGETCLIQGALRQATVSAKTPLVLLRIATAELRPLLTAHPELHDLLFHLLASRLVANALQTSPLFAAFDSAQRRQLARLFEVRRAAAGTVLERAGMRSDGLYLLLVGHIEATVGPVMRRISPGSAFGYRSLLSRATADRTVTARSECVVLRMPAGKFASFAVQYPPAVRHLGELAARATSVFPDD